MNHVSLFSGIGGLDLAAEWAGFHTVAQVERDPYCLRVLRRHWPRVPKFSDIRRVSGDTLRRVCDGRSPTVLSGGFPCQPFSCAGKRRGAEDDRHLWPEMLRVVQELRPAWVVGENVSGFISMALDDVLSDLDRSGYVCRAVVFPAAAVGAWHRRERVFIIAADNDSSRLPGARLHLRQGRSEQTAPNACGFGADISNPKHYGRTHSEESGGAIAGSCGSTAGSTDTLKPSGLYRSNRGDASVADPVVGKWESRRAALRVGRVKQLDPIFGREYWSAEPQVGRMAARFPGRVDRLRALGNAVVPQQAFPVFAAIAKVEREAGR